MIDRQHASESRKRRALRSVAQIGSMSWFVLDFAVAFIASMGAFLLSPHESATASLGGVLSLEFTLIALSFAAMTAILANILGLHELTLNIRFSALMNRCLLVAFAAVAIVSVLLLFVQFITLGRYIIVFSFLLIAIGLTATRLAKLLFVTRNRARILFYGSPRFQKSAHEDIQKDIWMSHHFEPTMLDHEKEYSTQDIINLGVSEVVINTDDEGVLSPENLFALTENGIRISSYAYFIEQNKQYIPINEIDTIWMINAQLDRAHPFYNSLKRLIDVMASFTGLLVFSPILIVLIFLIRRDSPGPAIYKQERVGQFGELFWIYKLRSMTNNAEKEGAQWAQVDDNRVTRIGAILRRTRLDELPQLWNVLSGEMSLVGPRPERPEFVDPLRQQIPFFDQRHLVKPGITGWAQINYPYGASVEDSKSKLSYDLYYIKHLSWSLDIHIMLRTVGTLAAGSR